MDMKDYFTSHISTDKVLEENQLCKHNLLSLTLLKEWSISFSELKIFGGTYGFLGSLSFFYFP